MKNRIRIAAVLFVLTGFASLVPDLEAYAADGKFNLVTALPGLLAIQVGFSLLAYRPFARRLAASLAVVSLGVSLMTFLLGTFAWFNGDGLSVTGSHEAVGALLSVATASFWAAWTLTSPEARQIFAEAA